MSFLDNLTAQLPFGKKSENSEYYFALNIGLSEVTAAVWGISGNELDILSQITTAYDGTEDLLDKSYKAMDQALGALEVEPQKVLFGIPESWGIDDDLKEPYLKLLRRMLKEFDLTPMAYVTTNNAISFLLQKQEGAPTTAVLLGIGDYVEITLIRGGKIAESLSAKRSGQLFEDIEKLLRQFTEVETLPSKILLYSIKKEENLNKIKDELMSYPWMQKLPFLHFPKIEALDENIATLAIILAGAVEINPDVDLKRTLAASKRGLVNTPQMHKQSLMNKESPNETGGRLKRGASAEGSGFVAGDIKEHLDGHQDTEEELEKDKEDLLDDNLVSPDVPESFEESFSEEEISEEDHLDSEPRFPKPIPRRYQAGLTTTNREIHSNHQSFSPEWMTKIKSLIPLSLGSSFKNPLLGKLILLPVIMMIMAAAYVFLFKANVTIFVEPKVLEQDANVTADPKATAVDEEKNIIPGSVVETAVSGSGKAPATGQKQIGDPAKGKVVIYNLTDSRVSFSQGAALSANGLKFTLDSSVQIASQSSSIGADFTTVIKPGKSDSIGVTAAGIGPEGNLSAGTDLVVGNYQKSQVVARVEDAFAGGTSKNVTVVTLDDQKKLQAKVLNDLRQKAESDLQTKMTNDKKIISEALSVVDSKYTFNKQVNDQANEFTLNANVKLRGTAYSDADLKSMVSKLIKTNVPDGFELNLSGTETQADVAKVEKDGRLIFKAKFRAQLLPKLNLEDLKKQMRGQGVNDVADKLKQMEGVMGSEIKISPSLPTPLARLPLLDKNISITVTPK